MSRMIRKQIYIDLAQEALLKQRAQELGVSEAEFIRNTENGVNISGAPNNTVGGRTSFIMNILPWFFTSFGS